MNRYRVVRAPAGWPEKLPFRVGWPGHERDYGVGDEFVREFTPEEEADNLASGLLEIVPAKYRVIGGSEVWGVTKDDPDPTFEKAMLIEAEQALIVGGHIERVVEKQTQTNPKKKETT